MNRKTLGVFIILAMTALACTCNLLPDGGDGGGGGGADPTVAPPPENVLFQDDFSDSNSGWEVGDYDDGDVGYKDGVYFVTSVNLETLMWGVASRSFDNVIIEVDATQTTAGATNDNAYGVACREQDGSGDGYYLRISGDDDASKQETCEIEMGQKPLIFDGRGVTRARATEDGVIQVSIIDDIITVSPISPGKSLLTFERGEGAPKTIEVVVHSAIADEQ